MKTATEVRVGIEEEQKRLTARYVGPHKVKSKEATVRDIKTILEDSEDMVKLCYTQIGVYPGGFAVAHEQIEKKRPLRFFAICDGRIIINPVIVRHTNNTVKSVEGCLSFPGLYPIEVDRWNKCEVEYYEINKDKASFTEKRKENLSGREAKIFQHEIDHFDNKYIYEESK